MPNALQTLHNLEPSVGEFRDAVMRGLQASPKTLPCKFFYDEEGSRLFDRICELPEYYPTRTELRILRDHANEIACWLGSGARLVEFGSGAGIKIRLLLSALTKPSVYIPVDISRQHLLAAVAGLACDFPTLPITPICADYTHSFVLPKGTGGDASVTAGFFPGSTIGNFTPAEAVTFLESARLLLGAGSMMIVGVDLRKDEDTLKRAYNDSSGVTAAFNLNLLRRINRELGGTFLLGNFVHDARWNRILGRIEMHLVSRKDQTIRIGEKQVSFREGESVHTENSHKYSLDEFEALASSAGYETREVWTDSSDLFSVHMLRDAVS